MALSLESLQTDIHTALQTWHQAGEPPPALEQLVTLSLVQVSGGLDERRYTIHRLTETFLLEEAIK